MDRSTLEKIRETLIERRRRLGEGAGRDQQRQATRHAMQLAAKEAGFSLSAIGGGIAAAGLVYVLFALLVLLIGSERVRQVFPPVVTGPVIVVIGLTLAPVAVEMAGKD